MARLVFGGDDVSRRGAIDTAILSAAGDTVTVYTSAAGSPPPLANIVTYPGGVAISGSTLTVDTNSQLPLFQGPNDDSDTLYVSVNGGPIVAIYARIDDRLDALAASNAAKQPHDLDLDAIAALDSSTAGALVTDGAGWIRKSYSQLKTALGLGNVDNTSDANKPVSTAQAAADAATVSSAQTFATGAVGTEASRAMTAEASKLVAGSTATYANLAALPSASAHTNEVHKTLDGGVYESTGSAWVQLVAPSGTYALVGDGASAGAAATAALLKEWTAGECYELTAITRDGDEVVTTATVKWPDGSAGTFTMVTKNATWLTIDAFTVSHTLSGKTVTQAAVTRDAGGAVTTKPAMTVA